MVWKGCLLAVDEQNVLRKAENEWKMMSVQVSKDLEHPTQLPFLDWVCKHLSQIFPDTVVCISLNLSFFVRGRILFCVPCTYSFLRLSPQSLPRDGHTHTQKKPIRLCLCKHSINPWSAWDSWWFVCAHLGLKSSDMRWMWSSLTFWEAPSALVNLKCLLQPFCIRKLWVKLNLQECICK